MIDRTEDPPVCLPTSAPRERLLDITPVGAPWRIFVDPESNRRYDGAVYFRNLIKEARHG